MLVSEITAFLEQAYDVLNDKYFDGSLTKVVITVQSTPRVYGHYTVNEMWSENEDGYHEINLGAETLSRQCCELLGTLLHEMTHHYCALNGIKDTSRGGTYHNKRFKQEAEKRGLIIGYDSRIGFSPTTPSEELISFVKEQGWEDIDLSRKNSGFDFGGGGGGRRVQKVRKYMCPMCGCSVRATKAVNIGCLDCGVEMPLVEN